MIFIHIIIILFYICYYFNQFYIKHLELLLYYLCTI